jgi:putative membrane-bound dehydrogenase-like protein
LVSLLAFACGPHRLGAVTVPQMVPGWRMELMLESPRLNHPSVVCSAPDGRVFVAEDPMDIQPGVPAESESGRILCLHPDGHLTVFAKQLHAVFGMQYLEGRLYVLHNPKFSRFTDDQGVGRDRTELIQQTTPRPWALDWNDHVPANFKLGMDGFFHVAVGDKGLYGAEGTDGSKVTLHGGGMLRLRPNGTRLEVTSRGVRNIMDVALNAFDDRFTYDNTDEHDWMGRLTHMVDQGVYGYPHDFIPRRPYTLWMMHDFGGGAATGVECYTGAALPAEFRGNLFLGDFGKRQVLRVVIAREGASYRVVRHQELFVNPPEEFRPVGIAWSADERSLWICDWAHRDTKEAVKAGRLWRATRDDAGTVAFPAWYLLAALGKSVAADDATLLEGLAHPSRAVRLLAQRQLSARPGWPLVLELEARAMDLKAAPLTRIHALWGLLESNRKRGLDMASRWLSIYGTNESPELLAQAARVLGEAGSTNMVPVLLPRPRSDPLVEFHAATAAGRLGQISAVPALLRSLMQKDDFVRFAAFTALNRIGRAHPEAWARILAGLEDAEARVREGTVFALRETFDASLVRSLIHWIDRSTHHEGRVAAVTVLASLALQQAPWEGGWWAYHPALSPAPRPAVEWAATASIRARLIQALEDPEGRMRVAAIDGLGAIQERTAIPALLKRLQTETDPAVQRAAVNAFEAMRASEAAPWIASLIRSPAGETAVLREAIAAAAAVGGDEVARAVLAVANGRGPVRLEAVQALGRLQCEGAVQALAAAAVDSNPEIRTAAIRALGLVRDPAALGVLTELARTAKGEDRLAVVRALGTLQNADAVPVLLSLWQDPAVRDGALEALSVRGDARALDAYLEGLAHVNPVVRDRCRKALRAVRDVALPLIEPRVASLPARVVLELRDVYQGHSRATNGVVFTRAVSVSSPEEYARFALDHPGDPVRGQRVFWDATGVACIRCHAVAGQGSSLGPDMTLIGAQFGRRELIENVLYPSRSVREGYQQVLVETKEGDSLGGIVRSETAESLTLVDALGQLHPVAKSTIARRETSPLSLMPEGLQTGLSMEQFADLISYLESRRVDPRIPAVTPAPAGWTPLLTGQTEGVPSGWVELPAGTKRVDAAMLLRGRPAEHWTLKQGILEHDGLTGDLWTTREVGDFELRLEWRWVGPFTWEAFPLINADGLEAGPDGRSATARVLDAGDSGVLFRGLYKAQANLFCYPVGSGEFWEYRTDAASTPAQRRAFTPRRQADRPLGDWNEMRIQARGNRVEVHLNGEEVIHDAELPGLPERGPIGLQHEHGRLQVRNVFLRELPSRQP